MVRIIFTKEERNKFKFIWDQSRIVDSNVPRLDARCNIMLKDLTTVWNTPEFVGVYDDSNTVLIDDSPIKTFVNPRFTSLYPTTFKFGDCEDTFLPDILWPFLQKLSLAQDVKRFLQLNMPKWSLRNQKVDEEKNVAAYAALCKGFCVTKPSIPQYTLLDVSDYEVSMREKRIISFLPPYHHCTAENIKEAALELLGKSYQGPYVNDPLQFIHKYGNLRHPVTSFI